MNRILLGEGLLCLSVLSAQAGDEIYANRVGNTIIMKRSDGIVMKTHYRADHTIDGDVNGVPFTGMWAINSENRACVAQWPELTGSPNPRCFPAVSNEIGKEWTGGRNGRTQTEIILPGVQ